MDSRRVHESLKGRTHRDAAHRRQGSRRRRGRSDSEQHRRGLRPCPGYLDADRQYARPAQRPHGDSPAQRRPDCRRRQGWTAFASHPDRAVRTRFRGLGHSWQDSVSPVGSRRRANACPVLRYGDAYSSGRLRCKRSEHEHRGILRLGIPQVDSDPAHVGPSMGTRGCRPAGWTDRRSRRGGTSRDASGERRGVRPCCGRVG